MRCRLNAKAPAFIGMALAAGLSLPAAAADITIGLGAEASSADPHFHDVGPNNALAMHIFSMLVKTDANLQVQPDLAASWSLEGQTKWTFKLRQGVTFHDGSPLTANDVVYSYCRALNVDGSPGSFSSIPKGMAAVETPDDHTLVITTKQPDPVMLVRLADIAILSAKANGVSGKVVFNADNQCGLTNLPASSDFNSGKAAVGTGPYKLERFTSGDVVILKANKRYFGKQPNWDSVTFKAIPADGPRLAGLLSGDYDLIENPSSKDIPALKRQGGFAWTITPSNRVMFLLPDVGRADSPLVRAADGKNPLQDNRVREAISLAIDREAIVKRIMDGMATAADQYLPKGYFGALESAPKRAYDPEKARKLLAEAGYPNGFAITLSSPNDRYINDDKIAQAVAQYLSKVGIETDLDAMTKSVFFSRRRKLEFSLSLAGWGSSTGEASSLLRAFVVTRDKDRRIGMSNYGGFSDAEFDTVFLNAIAEMDDAKRRKLLQDSTLIALQKNAVIPLHWEASAWAYKDKYDFQGRSDQVTLADSLSAKKN